jgi:hypothetical protein
MIYIVTAIVLFIFWYLNKKSENKFFYQEEKVIRQKLNLCLEVCKDFEWSPVDEIKLRIAFEHFILKPNEFNGTSVINDNWVIKGLEPESVIHDYDWIMANSLKQLLISNLDYVQRLRKRNVNWFWCWGFIFVSLNIVGIFKSIKYI